MIYEYIVDPRTGDQIPLNTKRGIKILINYIRQQNAIKNFNNNK